MENFALIETICTLSEFEGVDGTPMAKECNIISWDHKQPVIDIRAWNADHSIMTGGIKLTEAEMLALVKGLKKRFNKKEN